MPQEPYPLQVPRPSLPVTGNTEHTRPENRAFFPALDGLRALALCLVFLSHYIHLPWGWAGVNAFFVLSGFLITGILFDTRHDLHRARNFYLRRTLRIFPLYYAVLLGVVVFCPVFHWQWSSAMFAWPLYLGNYLRLLSPSAATPNTPLQLAADFQLISPLLPHTKVYLGHFWTLCVEEQFYLLWPWLVFSIGSRRKLIWICSIAVMGVPLLRMLTQHTAPSWMLASGLLNNTLIAQLDSLMLGGLIALLWRGKALHRDRLVRLGRAAFPLLALLFGLYLAFTIHPSATPDWRLGYLYPAWRPTWGVTFLNLLAGAVLLCCLRPTDFFTRALTLRPLRWVGRISYGAYVFHDILHDLYAHTTVVLSRHLRLCAQHPETTLVLLGLSSTLLLAWLSFRFFESPFLNLKERWTVRDTTHHL